MSRSSKDLEKKMRPYAETERKLKFHAQVAQTFAPRIHFDVHILASALYSICFCGL